MTSTPRQIRDSNVSGAVLLWAIGIVFLSLSLLMFWLSGQHGPKKPPPLWMPGLFCLIGVLILSLAVYVSLVVAKYGRSIFESAYLPATTGGVLTGTVRIPRPFAYREPIHLQLVCMERTGSGKNLQEMLVWEDRSTQDGFSFGASISEFPVYFKIPGDAMPSRMGGISWRLQAKARTQDVHYSAAFLIPVAGGGAAEVPEIPDPTIAFRSPEPPRRQPLNQYLHFIPLPGGGQFELMPARNLGLALQMILYGAIFAGAGAGFIALTRNSSEARSFFPLIFLGIGLLMALAGLRLLFLKTTVNVSRGVITIENAVALMRRRKEIRAADISMISAKSQGASGNRPFYSINLTNSNGNNIKICGTIYDKADAEWMASEIERELAGK